MILYESIITKLWKIITNEWYNNLWILVIISTINKLEYFIKLKADLLHKSYVFKWYLAIFTYIIVSKILILKKYQFWIKNLLNNFINKKNTNKFLNIKS